MAGNPNNNGNNYVPLPLSLGCPPPSSVGRRAIHVVIDFSLGSQFALDLSQVQAQGQFDSAQTLYIDNSNGTGSITVGTGVLLQTLIVPAGGQAYLPILQNNPPQLTFTVSTGTPKINVFILNFFLPPIVWYTAGLPVTDLTLAAVISNGGVNVNISPATLTGVIDASGTIATGGTVQSLFAADPARKRFLVCNPSTATEVLQITYGVGTNGKYDIPVGTTWDEDDAAVSGDAIFIVAATTGHAFSAARWG